MNIINCIIILQRAWRKKTIEQKRKCRSMLFIKIRIECESCGIFTINKNKLCYECNYYNKYS